MKLKVCVSVLVMLMLVIVLPSFTTSALPNPLPFFGIKKGRNNQYRQPHSHHYQQQQPCYIYHQHQQQQPCVYWNNDNDCNNYYQQW
ncbi:hypothetical protein Pcinc_027673 [Petrolisthes cinctipes]|uniref:Uncharacterized protein n=1 Tax=Petrolisthes cinctipes TaxID=88211 RepID=A0AAE1F3Y2_PETCI|nr:hypothetical protein Pcinc_027673 [Petrolisthes cinctipes]